jgi:hypothetical protein
LSVVDQRVEDLKAELSAGRVVVIVGAGVTATCTNVDSARSWINLIESGIKYASDHRTGLPADFDEYVRNDLKRTDFASSLISAAQKVVEALGGATSADYAAWLRQSVGEIAAHTSPVVNALTLLGCPIASVNYDSCIEKLTGRETCTWRQPAEAQAALYGRTQDIVHLHGHWKEPQSVVFGGGSYGEVTSNAPTQALEKALGSLRCLLFVGCGTGLADPNFDGLRKWLVETFRESHVKHYRLCLDSEFDELEVERGSENLLPVPYGSEYSDLAPFLTSLAVEEAQRETRTELQLATNEIIESIRATSILADHLSDVQIRGLNDLVIPPVLLPVSHEQYVAAQRDEDGPKISRIDVDGDLGQHRVIVLAAEESAGLTTALQWLVARKAELNPSLAPVLIDYGTLRGLRPLDRSLRHELRATGMSISANSTLPSSALALDNVMPSSNVAFGRMLADLPVDSAELIVLGCRRGAEIELMNALSESGIDAVLRHLGRLNTQDIKSLAALVAPSRASRLADLAISIVSREHLPRTPLTLSLLVSVLIQGESTLAAASETSLLDAYVNYLLGRGNPADDARFQLDAHEKVSLLASLAEQFAMRNSGELSESEVTATFEAYFSAVGWTESATELLDFLRRRHILIAREGKVHFAQSSYLHLFLAKRAIESSEFLSKLMEDPAYYTSSIRHYAALTRGNEELLRAIGKLAANPIIAASEIPRGANFTVYKNARTSMSDDDVDKFLDSLEVRHDGHSHEAVRVGGEEHDPLDSMEDRDPLPFPVVRIHEAPPLVQLIETLALVSTVLRDSELVKNLDLKFETLSHTLALWGRLVDFLEADSSFREVIGEVAKEYATKNNIAEKEQPAFLDYFVETAAVFTSLSGLTETLSSRKLILTLQRCLSDPEVQADPGALIMAALMSFDLRVKEWPEAFEIAQGKHPDVKAVTSILESIALYSNAYLELNDKDADRLISFLSNRLAARKPEPDSIASKQRRDKIERRLRQIRLRNAITGSKSASLPSGSSGDV